MGIEWYLTAIVGCLGWIASSLSKILAEQKLQTARLIEINRKTLDRS